MSIKFDGQSQVELGGPRSKLNLLNVSSDLTSSQDVAPSKAYHGHDFLILCQVSYESHNHHLEEPSVSAIVIIFADKHQMY